MANSIVASCAPLAGATAQLGGTKRNSGATPVAPTTGKPPMTGRELRAQLRAQQGRNTPATLRASPAAKSCAPLTENSEGTASRLTDAASERRRAKTLAMLEAEPTGRYVVIAEAGDPAVVGIAISGLAYGELEIPRQSYDGLVLLAMLERYGGGVPPTTH